MTSSRSTPAAAMSGAGSATSKFTCAPASSNLRKQLLPATSFDDLMKCAVTTSMGWPSVKSFLLVS
jgi:hypothetical protein